MLKKTVWGMIGVMIMVGAVVWGYPRWIKSPSNLSHHDVVSQESVLQRIRALNRLESSAFYIDTIIRTEKQGNWYALWQDSQKGIFIGKGNVVAGIDLDKLLEKNISVLNDRVVIQLPSVEILSVQLDHIEVYDWRTGAFNLMPTDAAVLNAVQLEAKKQLLNQACQNGILEQARTRSQEQIEHLFTLAQVNVSVYPSNKGECKIIRES